jgi:L-arabinose isomerase
MKKVVKVGLFGIGLDTYWPQFDGLKDKLLGYQKIVHQRLITDQNTVVDCGLVDSPVKANEAAEIFISEKVDIIFLFITTYALSHTVLPVAKRVNVPIIVLNLQPEKAINYEAFNKIDDRGKMTGEWLAYCQSCVAPEIASVFNRSGIKYNLISGYLLEEAVWTEAKAYITAMQVKLGMQNNRVGLLGHYYNGMLDVYSDVTQQAAAFGNHFEILEMGSLKELRDRVTTEEITNKINEFQSTFDVLDACEQTELERAAKTSIALDKLFEKNELGSMAFYYEGSGDANYLDIVTSMIPGLTLLTGKNRPVAGEYEVKNVQAMKIMDLMGCGGSFSEFYAMDFDDDVILLGHDGPAHFAIAEGKVGLVPLPVYHGKPGKGLSIQMKVQQGPVTLLSVCQNKDGKVSLLIAEAISEDGPTLHIGNTNSRYRFNIGIKDFINQWSLAGPSHHCAIGVRHTAHILHKLAWILGIESKQIG